MNLIHLIFHTELHNFQTNIMKVDLFKKTVSNTDETVLITKLYTLLMASGTIRHPVQDTKWWICIPCIRLIKTLKSIPWTAAQTCVDQIKESSPGEQPLIVVVTLRIKLCHNNTWHNKSRETEQKLIENIGLTYFQFCWLRVKVESIFFNCLCWWSEPSI